MQGLQSNFFCTTTRYANFAHSTFILGGVARVSAVVYMENWYGTPFWQLPFYPRHFTAIGFKLRLQTKPDPFQVVCRSNHTSDLLI